jgi:hypothetical protein
MNCWHCDRPAHGVCQFCGRAVCRDHVRAMPFILAIYQSKGGEHKAVVVEDTLHCGVCKPREAPVTLKALE